MRATHPAVKDADMADENPNDILEALPPAAEAARNAVRAGASLMLVAHSTPGAAETASAAASGASAASAVGIAKLGAGGLAGVLLLAGVLANVLGFLIIWPKTAREGLSRVLATMLGSIFGGPFVWVWVMQHHPSWFDLAANVAERYGLPGAYGMAMLGIQLACAAGLPFWWLLGAVMLFLDKRRGKDIGEIVQDATKIVRPS